MEILIIYYAGETVFFLGTNMKNILSRRGNMKSIKNLFKLMNGSGKTYGFAIVAVFISLVSSLLIPVVMRYTIDVIIGHKVLETSNWLLYLTNNKLVGAGLLIIVLTLIRGLFLFLKSFYSAKAAENISKNIKNKVIKHLHDVKFSFYSTHDTGDLIQRSTSDVETIRKFLSVQIVQVINIILMVSIIAYIMYGLSPKLTAIALCLTPFIIAFSFWFFFTIRKKFKVTDEAEGKLSSVLQENLNGIKVVKAFGREPFEIERFEKVNKDHSKKIATLVKSFAYYWSLSDVMCFTQVALVVIFGSLWAINGDITVGVLFAFITYEGMLLFPIRMLGRVLSEFGKALVSVDRIYEILNTEKEEIEDGNLTPEIKGEIEFKNVNFEYEKDKKVLEDISFHVYSGETIGILGTTGSGKSTLGYLMTRLYDATEGTIELDGIDIKNIKKKWIRKNVSLILQETFLYAKSIKENIGIRHKDATKDDIIRASKVAALHENVTNFEEGYNTLVGEKGVSLSGGQRQRVAIARTIIKPTKIMIFDDSLSAVDTETDQMIRRALKREFNKTTTFIVSHRIQTLSETDRILVVEDGKITAFGKHEELINKDGLYKRIYQIQNNIDKNVGA
jgi:ATP-binding cassette subfamily B protein